MAVSTVDVLHGIVNSSTFISQISNLRVTPGMQVAVLNSAGYHFPLFVGNMGQAQGFGFDCTQLKTILDLTGITMADLSANNTDLLFKRTTHLGTRVADGTSSHNRLRCADAGLICDSISAGHQSEAVASCRLVVPYDGSNEPIVPAGSQALSGTPTSATHYVAGPVTVNTVALPGIQDINIDFGISLMENGGEGELYNTHIAVMEARPVITVRCLAFPWSTYGLNGTSLTGLSLWLRKCSRTGRVANGTEEHILFTATAGLISIDETAAGGNDPAITTVRMSLIGADASTAPLVIDTTAAIS